MGCSDKSVRLLPGTEEFKPGHGHRTNRKTGDYSNHAELNEAETNLAAKRPEGAMFETGFKSFGDYAEKAPRLTRASVIQTPGRSGLKMRLVGGIAACAFMFAFVAPISIDFTTGEIAINAALAANGEGNFGNGRGNGGANGQNPGNNKNDGDGDGDDRDDDTGEGDTTPSTLPVTGEAGQNTGADAAATMADADFGEAIGAVAGSPAEGPMAATPATTLPTISQLFSMGDEAAVSTEDELELIANGWGAPN
jgi:hypothetical protein